MLKKAIYDYSLTEIEQYFAQEKIPSYRLKQLYNWLYKHLVFDFALMTNMPKDLRRKLANDFELPILEAATHQRSKDGSVKFLFRLRDNFLIESVLLFDGSRTTACVSAQVGCKFNCQICATGKMGFKRDLSAGEIVAQVTWLSQYLQQHCQGQKLNNVVLMGMGEPLDNLTAVLKAIEILNHPQGMQIGIRRFTISTCGLVNRILELSQHNLGLTLAISLHAADDKLRDILIPINKKYPLAELFAAAKQYFAVTKRRISFEYALFKGINDSQKDLKNLGQLLLGFPAHLNLMAASPSLDGTLQPASAEKVAFFATELAKRNIQLSVRKSRGQDIKAACGQLHPFEGGRLS